MDMEMCTLIWICVHGYGNVHIDMAMCPWLCVHGYVSMDMCPWICVHGYVSMDMCPWICVHGYVSMDMCPWICPISPILFRGVNQYEKSSDFYKLFCVHLYSTKEEKVDKGVHLVLINFKQTYCQTK